MAPARLPDFVIVGAMKSGTTTLAEWLRLQSELYLCEVKEPHFFSQDWQWERGLDWYGSLFAAARPDQIAGEKSTSYTDPPYAVHAAPRMAATIPEARLLYVVREPIARLRSDYRHHVRDGREHRPFAEAVGDESKGYVARSEYFRCLEPYIERFPRAQLCVVRFEDLVTPPHRAWDAVLSHLEVSPRPAPGTAHNVMDEMPYAPAVKRWLRARGLMPMVERLPGSLRTRVGRSIGRRDRGDALLASADADVPGEVHDRVAADVRRLESWLGAATPLWGQPTLRRGSSAAT